MSFETIWIIGAGRFGRIALERLSGQNPQRRFVLADSSAKRIEPPTLSNCKMVHWDGAAFLHENLVLGREPAWIIPALPRHLAAEWLLARLGPEKIRRMSLPESLKAMLPNPMFGDTGDVYISYANFLCPDDCPEPRDRCFVTGKKRETAMFDRLSTLSVPGYTPLTIRSRQLAPGVGGYRPSHLFDLLEKVRQARTHLMIATACRCHGVLTGMRKTGLD